MRLKAFDKNKNYSVKKISPKIMFIVGIIVAGLIGIVIFESYALYKTNNKINFIEGKVGEFSTADIKVAVYVDEEKTDTFPTKSENKVFQKLVCTNSGIASWNNTTWKLTVGDIDGPTSCDVYFVDDSRTLKERILDQGGGASAIVAKGNPNFTIVPTAATSGLYATQDEYGTSYYYRGEKVALANNVIFAQFQWKIVRINGDGSIRLIYNGACPNNSCTINSTGALTAISSAAWNENNGNDVKYMGFMYGGANGVASTSIEQAQTNQTTSNAKTILENWYVANIKNTEYELYIVDNIFCNDRKANGTNSGYGTITTYFGPYNRIYGSRLNPVPTLKCEQKNDRFTMSDTTVGNGVLKYPIGLITVDEGQYAGLGFETYNNSQYLITGQQYWTFSPSYFSSSYANIWRILPSGQMHHGNVNNAYGIRPVLNLKPVSVVSGGNGTESAPYIISD